MSIEEFERLQVYLVTYGAVALILTLWILPALVTSLTPHLQGGGWWYQGWAHHRVCDE